MTWPNLQIKKEKISRLQVRCWCIFNSSDPTAFMYFHAASSLSHCPGEYGIHDTYVTNCIFVVSISMEPKWFSISMWHLFARQMKSPDLMKRWREENTLTPLLTGLACKTGLQVITRYHLLTWPSVGQVWHKKLLELCREKQKCLHLDSEGKKNGMWQQQRGRSYKRTSVRGGAGWCSWGPITRPVCVCVYACLDCAPTLLLQVPWRAPGWPRFPSAHRLCWHWGTGLGPLAWRPDMTPSSQPVGAAPRARRRPPGSVMMLPAYAALRPLLSFHSINITRWKSHE